MVAVPRWVSTLIADHQEYRVKVVNAQSAAGDPVELLCYYLPSAYNSVKDFAVLSNYYCHINDKI